MGKGIVKLGEGQWAVKDGNLLAAKETNGRFKNTEFTVTRGTDATYVGKDGLIKDASFYNLIDYSEDFSQGDWIKNNTSISANNTTSPSGIINAYKLIEDTSNSQHSIYDNVSWTSGQEYTFSAFAKKDERNILAFVFPYTAFGAWKYVSFNLENGTIITVDSGVTANIEDAGNGWYRCSATSTPNATTTADMTMKIQLIGNTQGESYLGDGTSGIYIWGGQLVEGTEALDYQYTNGKEGIPRIDFTDNTDGHLLLEPQRTNYVEYSNDASQWTDVVSNGTITSTSNYALAPNGENEATRLQLNSTTGYALKSEATTSFNDDYYISIYLKSNTTENQEVTIYGRNSLAISYTVTTQWQRFEVSCNNSSGSAFFNFGCRPSQGSDVDLDILAWGGQLEQGTYTTSYIPTNGSTVTRDAETCTGAGSSADFNSEEGVLYAEIAKFQDDNDNFVLLSLNNSSDNLDDNTVTIGFDSDDDFFIRVQANNVNVFYSNDQTSSKDVYYKIALSYKSGDSKIYINGNPITPNFGSLTGTFSFSSILDNLSFDYDGNGVLPFYGRVKAIKVYKEALGDTDLQNLTS